MNVTQQRSVRQRQSKLLSALQGAGAANRLPSTTSWSHDGLYMGDTAVLVSGHRLLLQPGAYVSGFSSVQLDGVEVAVSSEAVQLADGATITRESSSVLRVHTPAVSFTLVNSDRFVNLHDAVLTMSADQQLTTGHIDGLLGQTADASFAVSKAKAWRQHVEDDFLLPAGWPRRGRAVVERRSSTAATRREAGQWKSSKEGLTCSICECRRGCGAFTRCGGRRECFCSATVSMCASGVCGVRVWYIS